MADQAISDADFMQAAPATDDQQFMSARPQAVDLSDPVNEAIAQNSPEGKVVNASQGHWFTRPFAAAGIAVKNAITEGGQLGLSDESVKDLQDAGVLEDYKSNYLSLRKEITEVVLLPAAATADAAMRGINAVVSGGLALGGGLINEATGAVGGGRENPEAVAKDAQDAANALYLSGGIPELGSAGIAMAESRTAPTLREVMEIPKEGIVPDTKVPLHEKMETPVMKVPMPSPVIDEKTGNLNMKYVNAEDDAKTLLGRVSQAYADENGVVVSHEQTIKESQDFLDAAMKETANDIPEPLANYMRGDPVNRPALYAARKLSVQAAKDAFTAMQNAVRTGAPEDMKAALAADDKLMTLTGIRHEISAEAGRVLESHKIPVSEGATDADIEAAAEKLAGMTQEDRIRIMSTFDSPESIARFARDIKKPTWGEMGIFYVINNYLSGPLTHAAYAASWGVQTVIRSGLETPVASVIGRIQRQAGKVLNPTEVKALQDERTVLMERLAEADSTQGRKLLAKESATMQRRLTEIDSKLMNGTTVMPGEAVARFYGIAEGALDSLRAAGRALKTGNIQMLPGEMAKAKQAAKEAVDAAIKEGKSTAEAQKAGESAYNKAVIYSNNPILERANFIENKNARALAQTAGVIVGTPARVISAIHSLQKFSGYAESMNALAYRQAASEGLKSAEEIGARIAQIKNNPSPDMIRKAAEEAKYAALMGQPGKFGKAVENLAHVNGWTRMIVPFSRVVTNLANQKFLERTPLGLLSSDIRTALIGEKGNTAQAETIAKMLTGSTLLTAAAWLRAQGINNGEVPDDPNERARAYMAGTPPYTVRINDMNVPHRFFGVPGGSLSLGADIYDIFHNAEVNDEDAWSILGNSFHVIGNDMLQENALKGAADLYDAIRNRDQNAAKSYVLNAVTAAGTPFSVGLSQTSRMLDPLMRSTRGDDFWDRFKKTEMAHIPWESGSLLPQVDIFGRPMQRGGDYEAMLKDPVMQTLTRLNIYPAKVSTRVLNVKLNDQQYFDYATKAGTLFYRNANALISDPQWPSYSPRTQVELIHKAQKEARADARSYMCITYPGISKSCARYGLSTVEGAE